MKKSELIKLVENTIKKILKEGKSYKAYVIPIGTINIGTGKTMYDWSIYDHPNSEVALAQGSLLFGAPGLKIGDVFDLVDNDSQRSLRNSVKIQDIAKCKKEDVLAMLKKNGYDYYPARPFQKKSNTNKLNVSYSLKGYEELNNSAAYQKIIDHYTYEIVNLINVNKELSEKALYGELNKVVGDKTGDDSIEAVHRFLGYINSDEGKKDLLKSALSKISVVLDRRDWKYEDNPEQLKTDRIELKNKIIKELPNIYTSGNIFDKDRKISENKKISHKVNEAGKCPASGCTKKVGSKWRVISNKTGKLWPQHYDTKQDAQDALSAYHVHNESIDNDKDINGQYKKGDLVYNKDAGMNGLIGLVVSDKYNEDGFNYDVIYRGYNMQLIQEKERDLISIIPDYLELAIEKGDIQHYTNIAKRKGIKLNPIYQETIDNNLELDEISTSAGAGAYMTPNAFSSKTNDKVANMNGYKKVKVEDKELEEMIEQAIRKILVKEDISDKKFKKGDKVKTRDGNIETVIKVNSNGNIETEENNYSWPPSALEKINENILMKEEVGGKRFDVVSKEKNAMEYIVAYPNEYGIETEKTLHNWESNDPANRELYFAKDKKEAQDILKHLGYYTNMD